jgi:acetate kinase
LPQGRRMPNAEFRAPVLALNSGSSSLKFGLYRVGSSRTEMLLSGEAESIGDEKGKFHAQDSHENALLSETVAIPSQREVIIRIGRLLADAKMAGTGRHRASDRAWRTEAPAALPH